MEGDYGCPEIERHDGGCFREAVGRADIQLQNLFSWVSLEYGESIRHELENALSPRLNMTSKGNRAFALLEEILARNRQVYDVPPFTS